MSRVNHKRVKQLLNEKRSKITDRQFFSSRILVKEGRPFPVKNDVDVCFCLFLPPKCAIILPFQGEKRTNKWKLQMKCGVIPPRT